MMLRHPVLNAPLLRSLRKSAWLAGLWLLAFCVSCAGTPAEKIPAAPPVRQQHSAGKPGAPAPAVRTTAPLSETLAESDAAQPADVHRTTSALRKALEKFYPQLKEMQLNDYKVRVLPGTPGTAAQVRVLIESQDANNNWRTVGVSHDIIEASWQALVDSINYKMYSDEKMK